MQFLKPINKKRNKKRKSQSGAGFILFRTLSTFVIFGVLTLMMPFANADTIDTRPSAQALEQLDCDPSIYKWPLSPLTRNERSARLKFFSTNQRFTPISHAPDVSPSYCSALLERLKTLDSVSILDPDIKPSSLHSEPIKQLVKGCPNLHVGTVYIAPDTTLYVPGKSPDFDALPLPKKELRSAGIFRADSNIEIYDLSSYMGDGTYGYFAEGAIRYNGDNQCSPTGHKITGYSKYDRTLGAIFNTKECAFRFAPFFPVSRLTPICREFPCEGPYREDPSFFAFIVIDQHLFSVFFNSLIGWSDFNSLTNHGVSELLIQRLSPYSAPDPDHADAGIHEKFTCYFTSAEHPHHKILKD